MSMNKTAFIASVILEVTGIAGIGICVGAEAVAGGEVYLVGMAVSTLFVAAGGLVYAKFLKK